MAQQQKALDKESRQVGSRWYGEAPTGDEVAHWFALNVKIDDALSHDHYVQGVTLITQKETYKTIRNDTIVELERLVHVPYAKVETRVAYFWDLCLERGWLGVIEPVDVPRVKESGLNNTNLPKGFFRVPVPVVGQNQQQGYVHFVACGMKVSIYEPDLRSGGRGRLVRDAPPAVKQIALLDRWGKPDPFAMMKAETGAVGRALGMAGMLVLPGSGVATAEDMQEVEAGAQGGTSPAAAPQLPDEGAQGEATAPAPDPAAEIADLIGQLQSQSPAKFEELEAWAAERKPAIDLANPKNTQLRAVRAQVEKKLAQIET